MFHREKFQLEWTHTVKYCLDTLHISIKLSFLFTCCKVNTQGYNKFNCSKGSFKQWQNTTIIKTNVFIEQKWINIFVALYYVKYSYFIRLYVKMLHHKVMTRLNNSTVHSALFFMKACFLAFYFCWRTIIQTPL